MTTIAFDEYGVAADTASYEGTVFAGAVTKLHLLNDCILAWAGDTSEMQPMFDWYKAGAEPCCSPKNRERDGILLAFTPGGVFEYEYSSPTPQKAGFTRYAYGSGRSFAIGALFAGANAPQSVQAAIYFDAFTGGEVRYLPYPWLESRALGGFAA